DFSFTTINYVMTMKKIIAETAAHIPLCVLDKPRSTLVLGFNLSKNLKKSFKSPFFNQNLSYV
ncbi:MAG: hypothetical protein LBP89_06420, partial [Helicobacteraceae bacterium]|nr:hypothetical protein [Helicobacteraceae bacterium]